MSSKVCYCRLEIIVQGQADSAHDEARAVAENIGYALEKTDKQAKLLSVQGLEWSTGYRLFYGL